MDKNIIPFKEHTKYKIGAVTYDVTAHFYDDKETLKSKIISLLKNDARKTEPLHNICKQSKQ